MKYLGQSDYQHATVPRIGVLLTNLGTPEAPTAKALKPYLKAVLWDPRVVEVPRPIWWLILNGIILNTRPKRSAEAYSAVWNERGSPLLAHLEDQVAGVAEQLKSQHGDRFVVRGAMRYGSPAIADVLTEMFEAGVQKLVVLPLYPQYGGPTTGSTFDEVSSDLTRRRWLPAVALYQLVS
jgi:ferrochelatase